MKKTKLFSLVAAFMISMCFSLCACDNKDEHKETELTTDNVYHYLAFNMTVSDCIAEYIETDILNTRKYDLSCVITISTTKATDCYFKGKSYADKPTDKSTPPVTIKYNADNILELVGKGWQLPKKTVTQDTEIFAQVGFDGTSAVSFSVFYHNSSDIRFPNISTVTESAMSVVMDSAKIVSKVNGIVYA